MGWCGPGRFFVCEHELHVMSGGVFWRNDWRVRSGAMDGIELGVAWLSLRF